MRDMEVNKESIGSNGNFVGSFYMTVAGIVVKGIYQVQDESLFIDEIRVGMWKAEKTFEPRIHEYVYDRLLDEI